MSDLLHALDQRWVHFLLIALLMGTVAIYVAPHFRYAEQLDRVVQDQYFQLRGATPPSVVAEKLPQSRDIILIEAEHPISRHVLALLLNELREARVVLLDFALADRKSQLLEYEARFYTREIQQWGEEDKELSEAISRAGNVVLGTWQGERAMPDTRDPGTIVRKRGWQRPPKLIWEKARYRGHLSVQPDSSDGVVRRVRLFEQIEGMQVPCVGLTAAATMLGIRDSALSELRETDGYVDLGTRRIQVDADGTMLIDYLGNRASFERGPNCAAYQAVLAGLTDPSQFAGKIVIVGIASDQSGDMVVTPFETTSGMLVHANIIATLLSSKGPPAALSGTASAVAVLAASLIIVIPVLGLPIWSCLLLALLEIVGLAQIGEHLFRESHIVMGLSAPLMGIGLTLNAVGYYEYRRARQVLGRFVGQEMVPQALRLFGRLDLGGRETCASAFYCDVRGYSTLAEHMSPRDITALVNAYTSTLVTVVKRHGGRPITYQGDGTFVLFEGRIGEIDHAERAVRAADDLQSRFVELRRQWVAHGAPPMTIGIGIETGPMFVGLMGAAERVQFSAVGDAVNVAARVQSLTEDCGYDVLITSNTYELVKEAIVAVPCGSHTVRGREQSVQLYGVPRIQDGSNSERGRERRYHQRPRRDAGIPDGSAFFSLPPGQLASFSKVRRP